jgi:hypothetical protein
MDGASDDIRHNTGRIPCLVVTVHATSPRVTATIQGRLPTLAGNSPLSHDARHSAKAIVGKSAGKVDHSFFLADTRSRMIPIGRVEILVEEQRGERRRTLTVESGGATSASL